ncbi:fumarylacetoacetate hydrolase family protein [Halomonas sp. AOP42-C1-46]|uniref:fumarylacetoacetate hydrolase family protein n=1 Tax=Halomonas sp. AOP42-C1-46 TaxID=3457671 RepID=UPI004034510A
MRLVTFSQNAKTGRLGLLSDDLVVDVEKLGKAFGIDFPGSMLEFIDLGPSAVSALSGLSEKMNGEWPVGVAVPVSNVKLLAPIPRPRKNIFGIGLNYKKHVEESSRSLDTSADLPKEPVIFSKPPAAVVGPNDAVLHNAALTQQLDWEVELAAIMGRGAKDVSVDDALNYVFGYSVMIDISARDCRRAGQWIVSKGQDTFAPFGPCIVTADEIGDPQNLNLSLKLNGVIKQDSNTRHMIFSVAELVSDISTAMSLEPGDIIATGTPDGVGAGRDPQEWMWPGDVMEATVEKIGTIRNPIVKV